MPDPITSVRSPHIAPEPKLSCMSVTPFQKALEILLCGMCDIPDQRIAGDRRSREVVCPPHFDQLLDRMRCGALVGFNRLFEHRRLREFCAVHLTTASDAKDLDGHDGDGLVPEYPFISLDLSGDIRVLHHLRQAQ